MRDDIVPEMLVQHVLVSPAPAPDVDPVVVEIILSRVEELLGRAQNSGAVSSTYQSIDQQHLKLLVANSNSSNSYISSVSQ